MKDSPGENALFYGSLILLTTLGGKFLALELTPVQEYVLSHPWIRKVILFAIAYTATRDLLQSLLLTGAYILFVVYLLNEDSDLCLLPDSFTEQVKPAHKKWLD